MESKFCELVFFTFHVFHIFPYNFLTFIVKNVFLIREKHFFCFKQTGCKRGG